MDKSSSTSSSNNKKSHYSIDFQGDISFGPIDSEIIYGDFIPKDGDNNLRILIKESNEIMKTTNNSMGLMIKKMDDIVNSMKLATCFVKIWMHGSFHNNMEIYKKKWKLPFYYRKIPKKNGSFHKKKENSIIK